MKEFNPNILKEYRAFENANKGNWNILSYLNFNYDIDAALSFHKFFAPDFVFQKGCLILSFRYDEKIFNDWFLSLKGEVKSIEKMCNLYEVKDFFHINKSEGDLNEKYLYLSEFLKYSWQIHLDKLYGLNRYEVVTFNQSDSLFITVNSI